MTQTELTAGIHDCACGRDHDCPIKAIRIGANALQSLPEVLDGYRHILLVADDNTDAVCGEQVREQLGDTVEAAVQGEQLQPILK